MTAPGFERRYKQGIDPAGGGYPGFNPSVTVENGLRIEKDVAVPMRDGVKIYVDIFRPEGELVAPIIAWSSYGKHSPQKLEHFPADTGVPKGKLSEYTAFESPDPVYWCPAGYAVIYVGHSDDLSAERFPFRHPAAPCWVRRAGSRWRVYSMARPYAACRCTPGTAVTARASS